MSKYVEYKKMLKRKNFIDLILTEKIKERCKIVGH